MADMQFSKESSLDLSDADEKQALIARIVMLNTELNKKHRVREYINPQETCSIDDLRSYYFYLLKDYLADLQIAEVKNQLN